MKRWLTEKSHKKVKKLFEKRYGRELTDEEIQEIATNLVGLMEAIYLHIKSNEHDHNAL